MVLEALRKRFSMAAFGWNSDLGGNRQALIAVSLALVVVASINCVIYCVRWRKAYELVDSIFLAYLGSSITGLLNLVLNTVLRSLPLDTLAIAAIVICSIFTVGCAIAVLYHWRDEFSASGLKRKRRRRRDHRLDDTELQRRQLLKLLSKNSDRAPSPDVTQNTFRIDIPDPTVERDEESNAMPQQPSEFPLARPLPTTSYNLKRHTISSIRSSTPDSVKKYSPVDSDQSRQPKYPIAELGDL
ncbi:hypothetical protein CIHG_00188 [Coccidioides immitis H538.4]|uniref:Uncharacterized protein n=1 Tax=Coccidioides immitis H538.4 TaxID=396776 RepID=A0A0J8RB17_COCIT|nr:hypothetical protein CIHG_00188 [Coccidioides immitis H538.4]